MVPIISVLYDLEIPGFLQNMRGNRFFLFKKNSRYFLEIDKIDDVFKLMKKLLRFRF